MNIIYRFGIPQYIITDNGKSFDNKLMNKICDLFGFKKHKSSMYHTAANGLAETFNKTLWSLLKKIISKSKRDWHERMEKLYGHIEQFIEHQREQPHIRLLLELKSSCYLSVRYLL